MKKKNNNNKGLRSLKGWLKCCGDIVTMDEATPDTDRVSTDMEKIVSRGWIEG